MHWMEFIVEILKALAWPIVTLTIMFKFRSEFFQLFSRLKKFKHRDTELEFDKGIHEIAKSLGKTDEKLANEVIERPYLKRLEELLSISPRASIVEAWISVEHLLWKHVEESFKGEIPPKVMSLKNVIRMVEYMGDLNESEKQFLFELNRLRNLAVHSQDFELSTTAAKKYLTLVDDFVGEWAGD